MKASSLIGMDIGTARSILGYWWVLDTYFLNGLSGKFIFFRPSTGRVELDTDRNIIKNVFPLSLELEV